MPREAMEYDVVIVGAGPAGLSTAIKLKQLDPNLNVCILEKGSEVGAHILSGNVFETRALDELLPKWKEQGAPIKTRVSKEKFLFLGKNKIENLVVDKIKLGEPDDSGRRKPEIQEKSEFIIKAPFKHNGKKGCSLRKVYFTFTGRMGQHC